MAFAISCECKFRITRNTVTPFKRYESGETRFDHINVDVEGPIPLHAGNRYCFPTIEGFSILIRFNYIY